MRFNLNPNHTRTFFVHSRWNKAWNLVDAHRMKSSMNELIRIPRFLRNFFITLIDRVKIQGAEVKPKGILFNCHMVSSTQKQKYLLKRTAYLD